MSTAQTLQVPDRRAAIIILSIFAIAIMGPVTGIPAWIMADGDLRDIQNGLISPLAYPSVRLGKTLAIIGTFCSPLWLWVFVIVFSVVFGVTLGSLGAVFGSLFS